MARRKPPVCTPCCPPGLEARAEHVAALKALAHVDRLRVFFHLVQAHHPVAANETQKALGLPAPTLSHHFDHLERAGLIERHRRDRFILSTVRRDLVTDLVRLLTACC